MRNRIRAALGVAGLVLVVGIASWWMGVSRPILPIPVPERLGEMDPQVREHLARLAQGVAAAPRDGALRADLGLAFAVNGLWAEARRCFQDAIQLGRGGPLPAQYAAVALHELGDASGAVAELASVVQRYPKTASAWYRLGAARVSTGDFSGAEEAFASVTRLVPGEWRGWAGVGEARLRRGQASAAIEPLERAIGLDPYARSAYHLLGQAYQSVGRREDAGRALAAGTGQTVGPMPDEWSVRALEHMRLLPDQFERFDALLAEGRIAEAAARMREAQKFHPSNSAVIVRLARAMTAEGRAAGAWTILEPALGRAAGDVALLSAGAEVLASLDRAGEALELARRALAQAPHSSEARVAEANALLAAGDDEAALRSLERAVAGDPGNVGLWVQIGDVEWHNLKRSDRAWNGYLEAHQRDPIHPVALERLVSLAIRRGDWGMAEEFLKDLRRLHGDVAMIEGLELSLRREREAR